MDLGIEGRSALGAVRIQGRSFGWRLWFKVGSEPEPAKAAHARAHLEEAGLLDLVDIHRGDTLETLRDVGGEIDLALIDGT